MKITHPYAGLNKRLTPSEAIVAYVEKVKDLPTLECGDRVKPYWKEQGIHLPGKAPGLVPAGKYTDPSTKEAKAAVLGLYKHLKGQPISRHLVAVALNFQVSDEVDKIRLALKEDGVTDIDPGDRGRSVRWTGAGASWVAEPKAKKAAEPVAKAPAKAPAKAKHPAGSGPAKRAAKAAAAAAALAEEHADEPGETPAQAPIDTPVEAPAVPPVEDPAPVPTTPESAAS